ncbi:ImmA/IrrE family metallo-endopeptidase [Thermosediminibacter litoriperuensis]|uniref:ImmA/IrrE family metallo-endopeptidase n=1 Tax=Thermosediminibacter litoriperuensis TaxID=291989 RepID=UPI0011E68835|nr:ImmA/IrrE family metallo-endopeptidase [Thermosediminibacter litoriperuensis]
MEGRRKNSGVARLDIKNVVRRLVKKYKTSDPFELMDALDIIYVKYPLPENVRGFYFSKLRRKIVVINSIYEKRRQIVTAAHELGHCLLHPKMNAIFLDLNTLLVTSKYENEACKFAAELLMYNIDLTKYEGYAMEQIACSLEIPENILRLAIKEGK